MVGPAEELAHLHHESGLHRIQRVPANERRGRVHSSTVSVAVLTPAVAPARPVWRPEDCDIAWFSGSGAGGQHRNKHANCARITHRPTGLVRVAQTRSRVQSQMEALAALQAAVEGRSRDRQQQALHGDRTRQIGVGSHGDRARVWAFQRGVVEDQRTGRHMPMKDALRGHLDRLWPAPVNNACEASTETEQPR